jgi:hypothetical protein
MKGIHAIPAGLVLLLVAAPAQAAPVGPQLAVQPPTAVHKVHGSHRSCQYSPRSDWWHRHIGPYRRAIDCGRQYYYYDDPYWYGPGITFGSATGIGSVATVSTAVRGSAAVTKGGGGAVARPPLTDGATRALEEPEPHREPGAQGLAARLRAKTCRSAA